MTQVMISLGYGRRVRSIEIEMFLYEPPEETSYPEGLF